MTERIEFCHRRLEPWGEWCGKDAEFVIWGKLFPTDALGPRCYDCAAEQIGHAALGDKYYAILDLRPLTRAEVAA